MHPGPVFLSAMLSAADHHMQNTGKRQGTVKKRAWLNKKSRRTYTHSSE
jgi:hypothetical protein